MEMITLWISVAAVFNFFNKSFLGSYKYFMKIYLVSELIKYWGNLEHRSLPNKKSHESLDFVVLNHTNPGSLKFAGTDEVLVACEQRIGLKGSVADGHGEAHLLIASGGGGASKEVTVFGSAYLTYVEASTVTEAQE